jgi:class 3 adenylate cyclase
MRCTRCRTESTTSKKFCVACGNPLSSRCPRCGVENAPTSAFCGECGATLDTHAASGGTHSPEASSTEQSDDATLEGERKIVTALFADLKGSTALMEDLDPEAAHAIVAPLLRIMTDTVLRYEAYVARTTGDGIFALFGAPTAYEDHPQRALYAALEMQRELRTEGRRRTAKGLGRTRSARRGSHR